MSRAGAAERSRGGSIARGQDRAHVSGRLEADGMGPDLEHLGSRSCAGRLERRAAELSHLGRFAVRWPVLRPARP